MKKYLLSLILFFSTVKCFSQNPGEWVWIHGDSASNSPGNFGVQGIPSPTNEPPSLYAACSWKDLNGNFWVFGGVQLNPNQYSDLWKYDSNTNEWTWVKGPGIPNDPGYYGTQGVSSPANNPPAVAWGTLAWTDSNNNLWMFGGIAPLYNCSNDLWKYNISTNEWTWIKGPQVFNQPAVYGIQGIPSPLNNPDGRQEITTHWVDSAGNFWFFGGAAFNRGNLNDMWEYRISTNEWVWMKGSQLTSAPGIYGLMGVEDPANVPTGRCVWSTWSDNENKFWLLGGIDSINEKNDLWRFNPSTNNWTWINGSSTLPSIGTDGIKCIPSSSNNPCFAVESRQTWNDNAGNFIVFCGTDSTRNNLWKYCVSSNAWFIVNGLSTWNMGNWGVKNISTPSNLPPPTQGSMSWSDSSGNLYMFGGIADMPFGLFAVTENCVSALWKYAPDPCCYGCSSIPLVSISNTDSEICPGTCTNFQSTSCNTSSYQWSFPSATPPTSTDANPTNICYSTPGTYDVQLIATNANGSDTLLLSNYITVYPTPPPQSITQSGDTLFAIAGAGTYQWYYNTTIINGATNYFYIAPQSGDYNVVCTDVNGCEVEAAIFNVIASAQFEVSCLRFEVYPNPAAEFVVVSSKFVVTAKEVFIYNMLDERVLAAPLRTTNSELRTIDVRTLPQGMYYLEVSDGEKVFRSKFVKQ